MKSLLKYIVLFSIIFAFNACKKNTTGGKTKITAHPAHHGKPINGATVYIKFNTTEMPSNPTSNYDMVVVGEEDEEHVHINGLRYGKYYLYAVGYDPEIAETVMGGTSLTIKWKDRKDNIDLDIAVSED
jgi:hypothetical protein